MEKKELKKANGDIYFEAMRPPGASYIIVNWIGIQSLETVVMGGNLLLAMMREKPCRGFLNSNRELIGPWEVAVPYLANKWAPAAHLLGLRYFSQVLSPGIYGRRSYETFKQQLKQLLITKSFEDQEAAEDWLHLRLT
jgi:hypothetical protein